MELLQLQLNSKVKLKLVQPAIKCSGRDEVTCYYRGIVESKFDHLIQIKIKSKGEEHFLIFSDYNKCLTPGFEDIKIMR